MDWGANSMPRGGIQLAQKKQILILARFEREYGFFRFHPHLHFLVTEGGVDEAGVFHEIPRIDDSRPAEIFAREVLGFFVRKELLSPEWAERILSWRHTGFNVHSLVRTKTKPEAERVGKYMLRPVLALERLTFLEPEGKVGYRLQIICRYTKVYVGLWKYTGDSHNLVTIFMRSIRLNVNGGERRVDSGLEFGYHRRMASIAPKCF